MAEDVRSRVTAEGGEARAASPFDALKPCHYDMSTEIRSDFSIWQGVRVLQKSRRSKRQFETFTYKFLTERDP